MKKTGIITITYNSAQVIKAFMQSVLAQTHTNFVLYIIDNISSDNTLPLLASYNDPRIVIIPNKENIGVAAGNNQGIRRALEDGCELLLLLNNDVEFEAALLEKLIAQLDEQGCSLAAPKMMYHPETSLIWWAGTKFSKYDGCMTKHIGIQEEDRGQYDKIEPMDYAPTCCVLMKKEVVDDTGLMDEKYFAYYDDTDFFYRIYAQGKHKLIYYPFVHFYHKVGGLSKMKEGGARKFKFNDFYIRLNTRNRVYYLRKQSHFWAWTNLVYFFFRMNVRFLFSGKYHLNGHTFALLNRSYLEGLRL
jgi:GT2 family glycosyltransferase